MTLPGSRLLSAARLVIEPETVARVLEPLVADWQREWLTRPTSSQRALEYVRGYAAFMTSAAYQLVREPVPRAMRRSSVVTLLLFGAIGVLPLMWLILAQRPQPYRPMPSSVYYWPLILQNAAISVALAALPMAMKLGARRAPQPATAARHLLRLSLAIAIGTFVLQAWLLPESGWVSRVAERNAIVAKLSAAQVTRVPPLRPNLRDMTLPQLIRRSSEPDERRYLRSELSSRLSIPIIALVLGLFGWSLARVCDTSRLPRLVFWWLFAVACYASIPWLGLILRVRWHLPSDLALWLPLGLWMIGALIAMRARPARVAGHQESASA